MDKKIFALILIALLFVLLYISETQSSTVLGLNITVNNTNLAPSFLGEPVGTGERVTGNLYYNNDSDIEIFLYAHASSVSQTSDIRLYINGTMVSSVSSKPVGAAPEENNKSIVAIIPRYSNYSAIFANYHHYEWREYKILSGNVTTNLSVSPDADCTVNCSFDGIWVNSIRKNDTADSYGIFINLSAPFQKISGTITNQINIMDGLSVTLQSIDSATGFFSLLDMSASNIHLAISDGTASVVDLYSNLFTINIEGQEYKYNHTYLDYQGANITGLNNTNATGKITLKEDNLQPGQIASNDFLNIHGNTTIPGIRIGSENNLTLGAFFAGYYARGNATNLLPLRKDDRMFSFGGNGYNGATFSSSATMDFYATGTWNSTSSPSKISLRVTDVGTTTRDTAMDISFNRTTIPNGNLSLTKRGSGFNMTSPDGADWCVTVTNAGALLVSATPCS